MNRTGPSVSTVSGLELPQGFNISDDKTDSLAIIGDLVDVLNTVVVAGVIATLNTLYRFYGCPIGQTIIFCSCGFFFFLLPFFLAYS